MQASSFSKRKICFQIGRSWRGVFLLFGLLVIAWMGLAACIRPSHQIPPSGTPVHFSGPEGLTITERIALPSPYVSVMFTYFGKRNFIVSVNYVDSHGVMSEETLVNTIGAYEGKVFVASEEPVIFEVIADESPWEARIEGLGKREQVAWQGKGDWVSHFFDAPNAGQWKITHQGTSNFMVKTYCMGADSVQWQVNNIGPYSEVVEVVFEGSPCVWIVNADGDWSINPW